MKAYSFISGSLTEGLVLSVDERFGQVVFLGQSGPKGARYEKVRLDRQNPAAAIGGKVLEAEPKKITLPAREGKPEKVFYTLAKPSGPSGQTTDAVLVRICTQGIYTRGTYGSWRAVEGQPEGLISGVGADTESTKNDSWSDGLVVMRPGDVIKITLSGGSKFDPYALYFDAAGKLTVVDFAQWQAGKAASQVQENASAAEIVYGVMPAYSFSKAGFAAGIKVTTVTAGGSILTLGRSGRYSKVVTLPVVGLPEVVTNAAVAKVNGQTALIAAEKVESGKFLVRVDTFELRGMGYTGAVAYRGRPTLMTEGFEVHSRMREDVKHLDQFWVLAEGDVLRVGQTREEMAGDVVIYVVGGAIRHEPFRPWQLRDARANPAEYIANGWCPMDRLPEEWKGKVIDVCDANRDDYLHSPFLVRSVQPVAIVGGWDSLKESDRFGLAVNSSMVWAKLRPELNPEAETKVLKAEEVIEFGDPPLPSGMRVYADIMTEKVHHEASWGYPTRDETVYVVKVADVPAQKYRITRYEKSGQSHEDKEPLGEVTETWTLRDSAGSYSKLRLPEGLTEPNGTYAIEFGSGRRSGWFIDVFVQESLDREKEQILAEVRENLPLRKLARPISGHEGIYGMPVADDGWTPCEPAKAAKWVLFEEDHRWPNAYPEAFVLKSMKGFRSKSSGATFQALVADYTRP